MRPFTIINEEVVIGMPPGIGDLHWIMTKLESFREKNNIERVKIVMNLGERTKRDVHDYSLDYLDLIPFVDSSESVLRPLHFKFALAGGAGTPLLKSCNGCDYLIEFNSRLENHVKLKDILPDYDADYDYPIYEPPEMKEFAKSFKRDIGGRLVLLYTSGIGANKNWTNNLWLVEDWMELARKIKNETKCKPVLVGAEWDENYAKKLMKLDKGNVIYNMVGKTSLTKLFALIREANVVVAFICGVGIMATQFRIPVACFWSIKNKKNPTGKFNRDFMRTWLPPWAEKVGYMPYGFGDKDATPAGIFNAIRRYL